MQILRGFKFKLKVNKSQAHTLTCWIGANRCLYNIAVMQRSMTDFREHKIGYSEQAAELPSLKKEFPWMKEVPAQTLQQTLMNVQSAYLRFYKGLASYPRTKKKSESVGIRFPTPQSIRILEHANPRKGLVQLPKIGILQFRKSREIEGELRSCTISRSVDGFQISFLCKIEVPNPAQPVGEIGIDLGIVHTIALSKPFEGCSFRDLPLLRIKEIEKKIAFHQVRLSRLKKYSNNWKKQKKKIGSLHHRLACIRRDFLWKVAGTLAKNHGSIVIEGLKTKNMSRSASGTVENPGRNVAQKSGLNRSILRQGWYMFSVMLEHKTQEYGSEVIRVDPKFSSQECSNCERKDSASRVEQALFSCVHCGHEENADTNAAKTILARGRRVIALRASA